MATGDYGAGIGPAGADPVTLATPRAVKLRVTARWDGFAKAFIQDSDGRLTEGHWVDLGMAIGLLFKQGSIASAKEVGSTLHLIDDLTSPNLARAIEDRVRKANPVARLLSDGHAVIESISHELRQHGGIIVAVNYRNLRLKDGRLHTIPYPS